MSDPSIRFKKQKITPGAPAWKGEGDDIVLWSHLMFPITDHRMAGEWLDEELVKGAFASGVPGDVDVAVPTNLVQEAIDRIQMQFSLEWKETERLVEPNKSDYDDQPNVRFQWKSACGGSRLMYVRSLQFATFVALELGITGEKRWGLVCGNCGSHPFCQSPQFRYDNSDGSSRDADLAAVDLIAPTTVLAKLIHDLVLHCSHSE